MNDKDLITWLESLRIRVGKHDVIISLSRINELIDKLKKKSGVPAN